MAAPKPERAVTKNDNEYNERRRITTNDGDMTTKWATVAGSLVGLAVCGGAIGLAAVSRPGPPTNAAPPQPTTTPPVSTTIVPPPPALPSHAATGQVRVAPQPGPVPIGTVARDPVTAAPGEPHGAGRPAADIPPYRGRFPAWAGFPPPQGTSPRTFYLDCMRQARAHGSSKAELTCQYLADWLPTG